jgi:subtilisin
MKKQIILIIILSLMAVSLIAPTTTVAKSDDETRVIVGFKDFPDAAIVNSHGGEKKHEFKSINAIACSLPTREIEALKKNPKVAYVEEDVEVQAVEYNPTSEDWGITKIGANLVHPTNKGSGIRVAVIDTGINYLHEDLDPNSDNSNSGYDYVNDDSDPFDDNGHGTHCAGIIAATINNPPIAVVGVAPEAKLYALKVLNSAGNGYTSDIIAAIQWAITNEMQVISMSLGSSVGSTSLQAACNEAFQNNIVVVAAAGNNGAARTGTNILYPARYANVIAVGATDKNNLRASFSNTGPELDLMAPGVSILSDYLDVSPNDGRNLDTLYMSGTSMATPHVAGTAALILKSNEAAWQSYGFTDGQNGWSSQEVTNVLIETADDLGATGKDNYYGYGIVDADQAALTPPPPPVIYEKTYSPTDPITVNRGTITSGSANSLYADDINDLSVKSAKVGVSQTIDYYSTSTVDVAPSTVNSLTITYDGSYSKSESQTLYLYNFVSKAWQSINTKQVGTSDVTITYTTNSPSNYISTDSLTLGQVWLRTYATQKTSTSFTCNADFTQLSIKYSV